MQSWIAKKGWLALSLAGAVSVAACGDDPTGVDDHAEPEGIVLRLSGQVVASYDGDSGSWTGELTVRAGQETAHFDVVFVDHDGDPVELEDDTYLEVDIANEAVAGWEQDTPGEFGGHLHGEAVGNTTAVFKLMHGSVGSGHADFVSAPVTVRVTS